jgi:hypothetical protein
MVENSQIGTFLGYGSAKGRALIDRETSYAFAVKPQRVERW